ncbi:DUF1090 domain-containing protein [Klebsiella aerogenes]|uniref:DUF1090 domain-containing protein n=1 Tax=Klebsiella aerogenes TaxID=548 RepID=UPI002DBFFAD9|nr:DUF1090 domain-containing protein [Klebsiella aerogenes]MEB5742666.1 DUF1090 domain-containing protein [Klebsiella aerogenes]
MKNVKEILIGLLVFAPFTSAFATAQPATGCDAKRQNIEQEIDYARKHKHAYSYRRIDGLEKALAEIQVHCTDESLRTERELDLQKKELKVEERRRELAEAQLYNNPVKINKKQRKLEEALVEVADAKAMLNK